MNMSYVWIYNNRQDITLHGNKYLLTDGIFRALSEIKGRALWKNKYSLLAIFAKHSILHLLEDSEYVLNFKYVGVLNTPRVLICQGYEFSGLHKMYLFS